MKKVILMRGPSGAGKSTLIADARFMDEGAIICSADHFFLNAEGEYEFNPMKLGEAHAYCFLLFVRCLREKRSLVVVDNTFIHAWEMDHYVEVALMMDYDVQVLQFKPTLISQANILARRSKAPAAVTQVMCCEMEHWPQHRSDHTDLVEVVNLTIDTLPGPS